MPGGPSMITPPPRPWASDVTDAPITFNSPARPRIGGVASRWPPTSNRPGGGRMGWSCPVYWPAAAVPVIVGIRPRPSRDFAVSGSAGRGSRSVKAAHELRQLFAGIDSEFGEGVVQVGFDGVRCDVQLLCH